MQYKIPRLVLYAGVISLAGVCLFAIIDNYDLAINQGLSTTLSCYNDTAFDQKTGEIRTIRICDTYNPQLVFFSSIILLIFDAIIFHYFNKTFSGKNEESARRFVKDLNKHYQNKYKNGNNENYLS